jgi:pantoate--beta-alanine ligase
VSIFVNKLQFNDLKDFEKYPRTLEEDIEKLSNTGCDVVFAPKDQEIPVLNNHYDLQGLDENMEGRYRTGYFQGMANIVMFFIDLIKPDRAYFGEKDFQQLAIVKMLAHNLFPQIKIVGCETVREKTGLAMSSRNKRLSDDEKKAASFLYEILMKARSLKNSNSVHEIKNWARKEFSENKNFKLEYFEIVDKNSLKKLDEWNDNEIACTAAFIGGVRLIDNISL